MTGIRMADPAVKIVFFLMFQWPRHPNLLFNFSRSYFNDLETTGSSIMATNTLPQFIGADQRRSLYVNVWDGSKNKSLLAIEN